MFSGDILVLKEQEVRSLLAGREMELIDTVRAAYRAHAMGDTSLPQSSFLRFPGDSPNRIIALPAHLGGEDGAAGMKWISSFPGNLAMGLDRASAVVILNSTETGRPKAVIEGSVISAKRTAASAALAALCLHKQEPVSCVGLIGCGVINFEILRFLVAVWPGARRFRIFDIDLEQALKFKEKSQKLFGEIEMLVAADIKAVLSGSSITSFATTVLEPHVSDLSVCSAENTILHISLRDLSPEVILSSDNIVDDVDHVCRTQTSIHLAEQSVGHRNFIRTTLPNILICAATARDDSGRVVVFSPFGLGILDIAVGKLVYDLAIARSFGKIIEAFCGT